MTVSCSRTIRKCKWSSHYNNYCNKIHFQFLVAVNLSAGSYGSNDLPPVLAGLQCMTGLEGSFSNCTPINGALLMNCNSTLAAAVSCEPVIG